MDIAIPCRIECPRAPPSRMRRDSRPGVPRNKPEITAFSKLLSSFPHQSWQSISRDIDSTISPCELRADQEYDNILTEGPLFRAVGPAGNVWLIALTAYRAGYTQWVLRPDGDVFLMND
jgi:hypothetical protein